jgi:MraZ protein
VEPSADYVTHVEPPRGTFQCKVDDKGRLKLPAALHKFLIRLDEETLFATSMDGRVARLYLIRTWKANEVFFNSFQGNQKAVADIALVANHFGQDTKVDQQGRIPLPDTLRKALKLDDQSVWIEHYRGRFNVYTDALYQERLTSALDGIQAKLDELEQQGLR